MTPHLESIKKKEFAGYIASPVENPLQQIVVIRGTESGLDWLADFEFVLKSFYEVPNGGKTEIGFSNLYRSMTVEYEDPGMHAGRFTDRSAGQAARWNKACCNGP